MSELHICRNCFTDSALQEFVEDNAEYTDCDFCDTESETEIAASFKLVADYVYECLLREYDDPREGLGWESREGGWMGETIHIYELLGATLEVVERQDVLEALDDHFGQQEWCRNEFYGISKSQEMIFDWRGFSDQVKHHSRYVFFRMADDGSSHVLDVIADVTQRVELVRTIDVKTPIYRARSNQPGMYFETAQELGPPPLELATLANRMSPPGIVMFYGSTDLDTAVCEVTDKSAQAVGVSVGEFHPSRRLRVLDLAALPEVPSLFEQVYQARWRHTLLFLQTFALDVAKRIKRDGHQHIEYVPTQVLTEYFRHVFSDKAGSGLDGILYRSSQRVHGISCVLFFNHEDCFDPLTIDRSKCLLELRKVHRCDASDVQNILANSQPRRY